MSKPNLLTKGTALAGHFEWLTASIIVAAEAANVSETKSIDAMRDIASAHNQNRRRLSTRSVRDRTPPA